MRTPHVLVLPLVLFSSSACVMVMDCPDGRCDGTSATFDQVVMRASDTLTVRHGPVSRLVAECGDGTLRVVDAPVSMGVLTVEARTFSMPGVEGGCALVVEAPALALLENSSLGTVEVHGMLQVDVVHNRGSGRVHVQYLVGPSVVRNSSLGDLAVDRAHGEDLQVVNEGSGDVAVEDAVVTRVALWNMSLGNVTARALDAADVQTDNAGSGTMWVDGRSDTHQVWLSSLGDVDGALLARQVTVVNSGSGDADVTAWDRAEVTVHSLGNVVVRGNPSVVVVHGTGSGDVLLAQ